MYDNGGLSREPMPGKLKWALGFVYFQVVAYAGVGLLARAAIDDAVSHGEELANPTLANFDEYGSFVAAVALLIAAIAATSGRGWARIMLVVIEAVSILNGLVSLFNGTVPAILGLTFAALVIRTLFNTEVRDWFEHREQLRDGGLAGPTYP